MEPPLPGVLVLLALLAMGAAIAIGLFASFPFGSTAHATLSALGGSSPLINVALIHLLLASVLLRRDFADRLGFVPCRHWVAWVVGALIAYGIAGAVLPARLFSGQTAVPIPSAEGVTDLPLAPTSANIAQTGFFVLAALTSYAFATLLVGKGQFEAVRRGLLSYAVMHASLGTSFVGKLPVFAPGVVGACRRGELAAPVRRLPTFATAPAISMAWLRLARRQSPREEQPNAKRRRCGTELPVRTVSARMRR